MSRYCGNNDATAALQAAEHWKDLALLADGSVFSDGKIWTIENLSLLSESIYLDQSESNEGYWLKLRRQLDGRSRAVFHLASEMNWLMLLCPSNVGPESKAKDLREVWELSGESIPSTADKWLSRETLEGVGSGGPGYNNHRWRELRYTVAIFTEFKGLSIDVQHALLRDPWAFDDWLSGRRESNKRQFRHMLLFLLFPETFERIFSGRDREKIVDALSNETDARSSGLGVVEIDRALFGLREKYEQLHGTTQLDFYLPPLAELWNAGKFAEVTQSVTRQHVLNALQEIDQHGIPAGAGSTKYDLIHEGRRYPPKLVLQLSAQSATGSDFPRDHFTGGEESRAFTVLRSLGFLIEGKDFLSAIVHKFIEQANDKISQSRSGYPSHFRGLEIKVGFGFGNYAAVPWISFLGAGQVTSNGIYPVLLYYREHGILILAYGISETQVPELKWKSLPEGTLTVRQYFESKHDKKIQKYGDSLVAFAERVSDDLDERSLTDSLDKMIDLYEKLLSASEPDQQPILDREIYTLDEATRDVFIPRQRLEEMLRRLRQKKNLILQGPPGVGKTYVAKRLAYLLMGERDRERVGMVQFHQAYAYEDFVQGFRPDGASFQRKNGVFHTFCDTARTDLAHDYVFIIDEINRANLSKVFGELMMLIEHDKRGPEWAVPLTYALDGDERFYVPPNVYIVGLMNTADRSLAMVDYALRRRFAFLDVEPGFDTEQYQAAMLERGADKSLIDRICANMQELNNAIASDATNLGKGFRIGHSYFCPEERSNEVPDADWYIEVIRSEISPLLEEYWFDDPKRHEEWMYKLLER